ncbi:hypothetical protein OQA88_7815 [Cercophora sp. LCS_1]
MSPPTELRWAILLCLLTQVTAFYIPGWSIKSYIKSEPIPLLVNKVYSDNTQLQYAYYSLPFVCPPKHQHHSGLLSGQSIPLNLGEVLRGDRITVSDINLSMQEDTDCAFLCTQAVTQSELDRARDMVRDAYLVEWIVDNLPGATNFITADATKKYYAAGFKLGSVDSSSGRPRYYINNHHTVIIRYRNAPGRAGDKGGKVVVGFEVYPKSVGKSTKRREDGCPANLDEVEGGLELKMPLGNTTDGQDGAVLEIPYSYSVFFREDKSIEWNRRWDLYFVNQEEGQRIHWLAIANSLIICGLLTGIVLMILARTIRADIKGSAGEDGKTRKRAPKEGIASLLEQVGEVDVSEGVLDDDDEALEDTTGWKMLHGDVFRTPKNGHILAPLVGSGMQLLFMAIGLVLLSAFGILNPSFRGGFISFAVGLFIFAGLFSGYFSSRVFKTFGGNDWRRNAAITALLFPGLLFSAVFILNLFVWAQASSTAIPFGTLVAIVVLWLCVQVPLVYVGSWYGFEKSSEWEHPTKTGSIPRQVPQQAWYIRGWRTALLAGLIPFAVIFIELLFVFHSVYQDKSGFYYVFGFLAVVLTILMVTIAEVTVVMIYIQLCAENYNWWWQSFMIGGGSAVWVFAYCGWYYFMKLHITGFLSIGFLTAYAFVRRIYGAIKAD